MAGATAPQPEGDATQGMVQVVYTQNAHANLGRSRFSRSTIPPPLWTRLLQFVMPSTFFRITR